jgi:quercetin dioxygenase-like cupin family protein
MACHTIDFQNLPWQQGSHPLEKKKTSEGAAVTLLEFAPGFSDPHPCFRGHAGMVLDGELELILEDSTVVRVIAGNAFQLDPGTKHSARNATDQPVRLFVFSY